MKSILTSLAVAGLMLSLVSSARAADEKTITGEGKCAKCALKESAKCQNVIQTKEEGKTVTYYVVQNDISKKFHEKICQETQKVTATGTIKKVNGKLELTPTKMELAKQ